MSLEMLWYFYEQECRRVTMKCGVDTCKQAIKYLRYNTECQDFTIRHCGGADERLPTAGPRVPQVSQLSSLITVTTSPARSQQNPPGRSVNTRTWLSHHMDDKQQSRPTRQANPSSFPKRAAWSVLKLIS